MTKDEAIKILARHLMQCGAMMPIEWVQKNGEGSEFMEAYEMAMDALKNEPVRCEDCVNYVNLSGVDNDRRCSIFCGCYDRPYPTEPDDFCSYGERRPTHD